MQSEQEVALRVERVEVGGEAVTYEVAGSGDEPVVLVHGLAGSTRWWAKTVPALASRYRVYVVDLPGFGSMRRFRGGFVLKDAWEWLAAWMEAVGLQRVHLVGHSMGGYICLRVAARRPEVVASLVLIDPAGVPTGRSTVGHLWPLIRESLLSSPELAPLIVWDALRSGPGTLWRASRELLAEDVREELHKVRVATLLVWGEKDMLVPAVLGHVLREEIAGARLVVLKGARHVPMIDSPRRLNRVLEKFLGEHGMSG